MARKELLQKEEWHIKKEVLKQGENLDNKTLFDATDEIAIHTILDRVDGETVFAEWNNDADGKIIGLRVTEKDQENSVNLKTLLYLDRLSLEKFNFQLEEPKKSQLAIVRQPPKQDQ